jgi:hypothetical protein
MFCTACGARVASSVPSTDATVVRPVPEQPVHVSPVEATAVRHAPVPPAAPARTPVRRTRSRAAFWGWVAAAAVVVGAASYALGTAAVQDDGDTTNGATGSTAPALNDTTGSPKSPKPSIDPQAMAQARALHTLIAQSATDKQRIATAAAQLQRCDHVQQAIQTFEDAAASRDHLVDQAAGLDVGLLPGGGAAVSHFSAALRAAAEADRAYVAWGESRHNVRIKVPAPHPKGKGKRHGHKAKPTYREVCRGGDALEAKAVQLSTASHGAKQETATAWNVVAAQFGLPTVTWTEL